MKYLTVVFAFTALLLSQHVTADESAERFFGKYIQLSDSFDSSVAELYSDNAKIHAYRKYPHGTERQMEIPGAQWKQLIARVMPLAKAQNDRSIYSEVAINRLGNGYKIKANRYSNRKCYTDTGYYMIVTPDSNGELKIVEEYSETQPQSDC